MSQKTRVNVMCAGGTWWLDCMAFALMAGCQAPTALPDVPIVGGTDAVREAVRAELGAFEAATGGGRARVSKVVIDERDPVGSWSPTSHVVRLDDDLPAVADPDELGVVEVLRHELCHALNRTEELHLEEEALYRRRADAIAAAGLYTEHLCRGTDCQEDETFAAYCSQGPWIARAAASGACAGDPVDSVAVFHHQAARVWYGADAPDASALAPPEATFDVVTHGDASVDEAHVVVAPGLPDVMALIWYTAGEYDDAVVEVATGAEVDLSAQDIAALAVDTWTRTAPPADPLVLNTVGQAWTGGASTWTVVFATFGETQVIRSMWHDGSEWHSVGDGCHASESPPFPLGDAAYALGIEGTRLSWYPLARE